MSIKQLNINHFRAITEATLTPNPQLNVIIGGNGSGKTTLLESIYYLGRGKSFRSSQLKKIVQHGQTGFTLYTQLNTQPAANIGIQKSNTDTIVKLNGQIIHTSSSLAQYLPLLLIHPESHYLLEQGPKQRRHFMNWGLFHVEHRFLSLWNTFLQTLKQRNALVRHKDSRTLPIWDQRLCDVAEEIDQLRLKYIQAIEAPFQHFCQQLLQLEQIKLVYKRGWDDKKSFHEILLAARQRDFECGYTRYGPQRADLIIYQNGQNIHQVVSRGQQKLVITALLLSQAQYLSEQRAQPTVILVDDITSELDISHCTKLYNTLLSMNSQLFITSVSDHLLSHIALPESYQMFHVEQGQLS